VSTDSLTVLNGFFAHEVVGRISRASVVEPDGTELTKGISVPPVPGGGGRRWRSDFDLLTMEELVSE
jgi:hypothetical protein